MLETPKDLNTLKVKILSIYNGQSAGNQFYLMNIKVESSETTRLTLILIS